MMDMHRVVGRISILLGILLIGMRATGAEPAGEPALSPALLEQRAVIEKGLAEALARGRQWTALPGGLYGFRSDASGRLWTIGPNWGWPALRYSVEQAYAGKSTLLQGANPLLLDSRGRFWVVDSERPWLLGCYDGTRWSYRRATGEDLGVLNAAACDELVAKQSQVTARYIPGTSRNLNDPGRFVVACEDAAGNIHFYGGSQAENGIGLGIHTRGSDGTWSFVQLFPPDSAEAEQRWAQHLAFHVTTDGTVILTSRWGELDEQTVRRFGVEPDPSPAHAGNDRRQFAFRHHAGTWELIAAAVCPLDEGPRSSRLVPLPDGAMASICGRGRITVTGPADLRRSPPDISKLIAALDGADEAARQKAGRDLTALGPAILPQLKSALQVTQGGELRARLLAIFHPVHRSMVEEHGKRFEFSDQFEVRRVVLCSVNADGCLRFVAEDCIDRTTNTGYEACFILLSRDGTRTFSPIPWAQWKEAGIDSAFGASDGFEDSRGRVWLRNAVCTDEHNALQRATPLGLSLDRPVAEDAEGRIYFHGVRWDGYFVFDPSAPVGKWSLPMKAFGPFDAVGTARWSPVGWALSKGQLMRLDGPQAEPIPGPAIAQDRGLAPCIGVLREGAIINKQGEALLWDGANWSAAPTLWELVQASAPHLVRLAGPVFDPRGESVPDVVLLAGNGRDALWFSERVDDGRNVQHFDGARWHEVGAAFNSDGPPHRVEALATYDNGNKLVVALGQREAIWSVRFGAGKLICEPIVTDNPQQTMFPHAIIPDARGGVWSQSFGTDNEIHRWPEDAEGPPSGFCKSLRFNDSEGRIWSMSTHNAPTIECRLPGGRWVALLVDEPPLDLIQGPDGRIWMLHQRGLTQLALQMGRSNMTEIVVVGFWPWGTPVNAFPNLFIDQRNGLWFRGDPEHMVRIELPAAPPTTQPVPTSE